jgi:hypothetical protein
MNNWRPDRLSVSLYATGVALSVFLSPFVMLYREVDGALSWTPYQIEIFMPFTIAALLLLTLSAPILFVALRWWRRIASRTGPTRTHVRRVLAVVVGSLGLGLILRIGWGGAAILFYLPFRPVAVTEYPRVLLGDSQILVFTCLTAVVWTLPAACYILSRRPLGDLNSSNRVFDSAI